jgi:hypothetical protein
MATVNKVTFMAHPGYVNPNSAVENLQVTCATRSFSSVYKHQPPQSKKLSVSYKE